VSSAAGGLTVPGLDEAAVIVTGGGSGIGAATARQFALASAAVVLAWRRASLLKQVADGTTAGGGRALCVPADRPARTARAGSRTPAWTGTAGSTGWSTTRP
jgi:citronellol/citronellal dehydrogenase